MDLLFDLFPIQFQTFVFDAAFVFTVGGQLTLLTKDQGRGKLLFAGDPMRHHRAGRLLDRRKTDRQRTDGLAQKAGEFIRSFCRRGIEHQITELIGKGHQDIAADSGLQVFFGNISFFSGEISG